MLALAHAASVVVSGEQRSVVSAGSRVSVKCLAVQLAFFRRDYNMERARQPKLKPKCVFSRKSPPPHKMHGAQVIEQLKMSGTLDAVKLIQGGYPTRIPYAGEAYLLGEVGMKPLGEAGSRRRALFYK